MTGRKALTSRFVQQKLSMILEAFQITTYSYSLTDLPAFSTFCVVQRLFQDLKCHIRIEPEHNRLRPTGLRAALNRSPAVFVATAREGMVTVSGLKSPVTYQCFKRLGLRTPTVCPGLMPI